MKYEIYASAGVNFELTLCYDYKIIFNFEIGPNNYAQNWL